MFRRLTTLATASLLLAASAGAGELGIGDAAPALKVSEWLKGAPVASFAKGHTYVIEFWATWCAPCRKSIPHISELQKEYADKVTFIGVNIWEREEGKVVPFVKKMGDKMGYTVAADFVPEGKSNRDGAMAQGWMRAAGQNGIPAAFIVDGHGQVAWIGHPMAIDEPLAKIVAGGWSREDAAREAKEVARSRAAYDKGRKQLSEALGHDNWKEVIAVVERMIAAAPEAEAELGPQKFRALLRMNAYDDAYAYARAYVKGPGEGFAMGLNAVAWMIVDPETKVARQDLELALVAAKLANKLTAMERPEMLDTLALVLFERGEREKAIEIQERAVKLSIGTMFEDELKGRLARYKKSPRPDGTRLAR